MNLARALERQWFQNQRVDDAEHGDVRADAEGQDENRDDGERRLHPQLSKGVAYVREKAFQTRPLPGFAAALFERRHVAELTPGLRGSARRRQAQLDEFGSAFLEVLPDLLGDIAEQFASPERALNPAHDCTGARTRRMPSIIRLKRDASSSRCLAPAAVCV
jgi:hypothetical protein